MTNVEKENQSLSGSLKKFEFYLFNSKMYETIRSSHKNDGGE